MNKKEYIGITIGPIFDTMNLSSSPCALWASSFIFSTISRLLCEKLVLNGIESDNIISPCFSFENNEELLGIINKNDGTGLFHDRIIFEKPDDFNITKICEIRKVVLEEIKEVFDLEGSGDYLNQYVMISAAEFSAENPILESGTILDSLELSKSVVFSEESNPILSLFTGGKESSKNEEIKKVVKKLGITDWQLLGENETIKDLGTIARQDSTDKKYNNYFAIVRADGDNMGKIIAGLKEKNDFIQFSATCLKYCNAISKAVRDYGGVTIYAGGDDLLALIPCKGNGEKETVFNFIMKANEVFTEYFKEYINNDEVNPKPSLSFGIMICYKKFPLYEALKKSAELLFAKAKSVKNCSVINLQKHSGQSVEIIVPNDLIGNIISLQQSILQETDKEEADKVLISALQKIALFEVLFNKADSDSVKNVFVNTFDAASHIGNDFVHETLPNIYMELVKCDNPVRALTYGEDNPAASFSSLLRIMKFYVEGGEENE